MSSAWEEAYDWEAQIARDINTVLAVARKVHPGRPFTFLGKGNAAFDGASPIWMIKQGKTELVLELLREGLNEHLLQG